MPLQTVIAVIIAAVGSTALWQFLQFLIGRKDKKDEKRDGLIDDIKSIKDGLAKSERDSCRTQMLLMMSIHPDERAEILKLAQHYFETLKGDWYMTSIFNKWLSANDIGTPIWFKEDD